MDTLFIHPEPQGQFTAWGRELGAIQSLGTDSLSALATRYAGARVVFFIPSSQCLLTTVSLSAGQRKQLAGNFAWLIEEQVGVDVETLHIIAGPEQADGQTPILVLPSMCWSHGVLPVVRLVGHCKPSSQMSSCSANPTTSLGHWI